MFPKAGPSLYDLIVLILVDLVSKIVRVLSECVGKALDRCRRLLRAALALVNPVNELRVLVVEAHFLCNINDGALFLDYPSDEFHPLFIAHFDVPAAAMLGVLANLLCLSLRQLSLRFGLLCLFDHFFNRSLLN